MGTTTQSRYILDTELINIDDVIKHWYINLRQLRHL